SQRADLPADRDGLPADPGRHTETVAEVPVRRVRQAGTGTRRHAEAAVGGAVVGGTAERHAATAAAAGGQHAARHRRGERPMNRRHILGPVVVLAGCLPLLASCGSGGFSGLYGAPLPGGADLGGHPYTVVAD